MLYVALLLQITSSLVWMSEYLKGLKTQKLNYIKRAFYKGFYSGLSRGTLVVFMLTLQGWLLPVISVLVGSALIQIVLLGLIWILTLISLTALKPYKSQWIFSAHLTQTSCLVFSIILSFFTSNQLGVGLSERLKSRILSPLLTASLVIPVVYLIVITISIAYEKLFLDTERDPKALKKKSTRKLLDSKTIQEIRSKFGVIDNHNFGSNNNWDFEMRIPIETKIQKEAIMMNKMKTLGSNGLVSHKTAVSIQKMSSIEQSNKNNVYNQKEKFMKYTSLHKFADLDSTLKNKYKNNVGSLN